MDDIRFLDNFTSVLAQRKGEMHQVEQVFCYEKEKNIKSYHEHLKFSDLKKKIKIKIV